MNCIINPKMVLTNIDTKSNWKRVLKYPVIFRPILQVLNQKTVLTGHEYECSDRGLSIHLHRIPILEGKRSKAGGRIPNKPKGTVRPAGVPVRDLHVRWPCWAQWLEGCGQRFLKISVSPQKAPVHSLCWIFIF